MKFRGEFVIPDGVVEIGHDAFSNCDYLTSVKIPDSVIEIGRETFMEYQSLKTIKNTR